MFVSEQPQSMMFPGLHPMAMMSTSNMGFTSRGSAGFAGGMYGTGPAPYPSMYQSSIPAAQSGGSQGGDSQVRAFRSDV
jgi:insulin-like growth factor 2 mRNA-binding protein 1